MRRIDTKDYGSVLTSDESLCSTDREEFWPQVGEKVLYGGKVMIITARVYSPNAIAPFIARFEREAGT
jgi:hypothetical protein